MVNYSDPKTIARDFTATVNLHHTFDGVFFWEFVSTLDYEWDVIRGRRPYRRTIWIYTVARVTTLMAMINEILSFDNNHRINCHAWGKFGLLFPNTAFASASLLILLRIVAIWKSVKIVIFIAIAIWLTDVFFLINGTVRVHTARATDSNDCTLLNPGSIKPNIMGSLVADVLLLLIMLFGLPRLRFGTAGHTFGLERILWKQGLLWLLIAIICEIPPTIFICLDLNEPMSFIFQPPNSVAMTIAATRMYRSLMVTGSSGISQESAQESGRTTISKLQIRAGPGSEPIPLSQIDSEALRTETERSFKSQTAGSSSYTSSDTREGNKEHEVGHDHDTDVTRGPEP